MIGWRKLTFFFVMLLGAFLTLEGEWLAKVLMSLATAFGLANGAEHIGKGISRDR